MLTFAVRRVALLAVLVTATAVTAGACGARPSASAVGDPVILAVPAQTPVPLPPRNTVTTTTTPAPKPKPKPKPKVNPSGAATDPSAVTVAAQQVEPNTTLAAVVFDRTAGAYRLSVNGDRQFRSASLVKLMIAIDALDRGASVDERKELSVMLMMSDDDIASTFWVKGGPNLIPRVVALIGLEGTEAPELAGRWGEVKVTANDMVRVYQYVLGRMPAEDRTLIVDALAQAPEYAADDFDQYFGIPDGLDAQWAIKQGWGNNDHAMVLHSTGLVGEKWRYVVILLTEHPLGSGWRTSANSVTAAAATLNGTLLRGA
jgi:hypothetical protein